MQGFALSDAFARVFNRRTEHRAAAVSAIILFFIYLSKAAPGIGWFDSAEWALVVESWGLGHPPGSPGYVLLSGLFAHAMPFAFDRSLVIFSGLCAALTLFPLDRILRTLGCTSGTMRFGWLLVGGLLPNVWLQAARIELYTLSTLIFFIVVSRTLHRKNGQARDWLTALIIGVLLTVNPLFGVLSSMVFVVICIKEEWNQGIRYLLTQTLVCVAAVIVGLLPYSYCFIVGGYDDRFIWGDWHSLDSVIFYFSGRDYAINWAGDPNRWDHLISFINYWWDEGSLPVVLLGMVLSVRAAAHALTLLLSNLAALVLLFFVVSNRLFFPDVPDYHGYLLPLYWGSVLGLAVGLRSISIRWQSLLFAVFALWANFAPSRSIAHRDLSAQKLPYKLMGDILQTTPPHSIVVLNSDHLIFPLMYLQFKGVRTDLIIFNEGFVNSAWYWRFLRAIHSDLNMPKVDIPMTRAQRLLNFLAKNPSRPIFFESSLSANKLRVLTCPALPFSLASKECKAVSVTPQVERLNSYWSITPSNLALSRKVIAKLAEDAAVTRLQLGDFEGGLEVLRAGIEPEERPKPCPVRTEKVSPTAPSLQPTLIGSSGRNKAHYLSLCKQLSPPDR